MKKSISALLGLTLIGTSIAIYSCSNQQPQPPVQDQATVDSTSAAEAVKKGEHLVSSIGCSDCHSPKKLGPQGPEIIAELNLSGYPGDRPVVKFDSKMIKEGFPMFYPDLTAAAGPWGISFAGNLTPDETGIGNWSEDQFRKALREGKYKGMDGTRPLLPPMPWMNYKNLTDDEIHCIFAYLKSIKPVHNIVPAAIAPDQL